MMSVPILNSEEKVIAVVQIINKANRKAFNEMDVNSLLVSWLTGQLVV